MFDNIFIRVRSGNLLMNPGKMCIVGIVMISLVGVWVGVTRIVAVSENGGLVLCDTCVDFGEQPPTSNFEWDLIFLNPTEQDVDVVGISTSCSCTIVDQQEFVVPKHGEYRTTLKIDLFKAYGDLGTMVLGKRAIGLRIVPRLKNGFAHNSGWEIKGTVHKAIAFESVAVDFGELMEGIEPKARRIKGVCDSRLKSIEIESNMHALSCRVVERDVESGTFEIEIVPSRIPPFGKFEYLVNVMGLWTNVDAKKSTVSQLRVLGEVRNSISAQPLEVKFGALELGRCSDQTVLMTNLNKDKEKSDLVVNSVKVDDNSGIDVQRLPFDVGGKPAFKITQTILLPGMQEHNVRFSVNETNVVRPIEVVVPVSYYGISPHE